MSIICRHTGIASCVSDRPWQSANDKIQTQGSTVMKGRSISFAKQLSNEPGLSPVFIGWIRRLVMILFLEDFVDPFPLGTGRVLISTDDAGEEHDVDGTHGLVV